MLVIITEDSRSGYMFWKLTHQIVLNNSENCCVIIAGSSISRRDIGGIGKVKGELKAQLGRLREIPGEHMVLLAIDNVINFGGADPITASQVQSLDISVRKERQNELNKDIKICFTHYFCFEEVFLSFKHLLSFVCSHNAPTELSAKANEIAAIIYKNLTNPAKVYTNYLIELNNGKALTAIDPTSCLAFLGSKFNKTDRDISNREVVASLALQYITGVNHEVGFLVDKSGIGCCWYSDCLNPGDALHKRSRRFSAETCNECGTYRAKHFYGESKWRVLISNSYLLTTGAVNIKLLRQYVKKEEL